MHDPVADVMDSRWNRIAAVLDQVLEAPTKERARLLHELAGADAGIHAEVARLLKAADRDDGVLDRDAGDYFGSFFEAALTQGEETLAADQVPQSVGPWRVLREIGRGGMGVVYLVERSDGDFEQRAALKLLKRGLDTEAIVERFRQERRILARLTHPAIARLIDGGVADDGRPYLAMELAEGEPITTWCDRRRLPLEQRLRLFQSICDAVHYAHANLVVHRDLKPSNILVTEEGDLKLLDFGIAKLLSEEGEGEATEWTRMGVRAMTPDYAAPEQVRGDPVSTATDIYALGLILYELLIGRRPYEGKGQSRKELEHQILETEPMWPSMAVARGVANDEPGRAGDAGTERGLTAATLRRTLAGDLDAIVMKTLRKEPRERYASAQGLAEDLGRYQARQPITARPEGRIYRAGKFVRRHRLGVAMSAVVTLTLAGGLAVATWQARERALEARRAEAVKEFLVGIFKEADPVQARGEDLTVRELLDRGADQVRLELADEPELRGELLTVLGGIYAELSATDRASELTDEALGIHERLFGAGDRRVATNLRQQAALALARGEVEAAEPLARRALAAHRDELGAEHPEVAEDLDVLVITLVQAGRDAEALPLARDSLAIRRAAWDGEHRLVGDSLNNLAVLLRRQGELDEAAAVYAETVELRRRLLGPPHPHYALTLHNFAALEIVRGRYASAAPLQEEALESFERLYGPDHPLTLAANNNRAKILVGLADFDAAEAALRGVLEAWRRTQGEDHPNALTTTAGLAQVHRARGDLESAERLLRDVERRWNEVLGEDHVDGARIRRELGAVLAERGRYPEAEALLTEALGSLRSAHGDRHLEVATALHESGLLALDRGDLGAAESALADAWRQRRDLAGDGHPDTIATRLAMASVLAARGQVEEAESGFREALSKLRETLPGGHPAIAEAALGLGRTLLDAQDAGAAEEFLREAFSIRRETLGQAHWQTAEAGLWLGTCLARLDRLAEATTVLSQSLTVLATERGSDHQLTRRARAELQALGSV